MEKSSSLRKYNKNKSSLQNLESLAQTLAMNSCMNNPNHNESTPYQSIRETYLKYKQSKRREDKVSYMTIKDDFIHYSKKLYIQGQTNTEWEQSLANPIKEEETVTIESMMNQSSNEDNLTPQTVLTDNNVNTNNSTNQNPINSVLKPIEFKNPSVEYRLKPDKKPSCNSLTLQLPLDKRQGHHRKNSSIQIDKNFVSRLNF